MSALPASRERLKPGSGRSAQGAERGAWSPAVSGLEIELAKTQDRAKLQQDRLSSWSSSVLKRAFDFTCVLCALPILVPIYLLVGLAVGLTSPGPVLFTQKRMGRNGRLFSILKFRTMEHRPEASRRVITTAKDERFTSIGPFLRRSKLDELPQLLHVLVGQMSLVGPRPKVPEHEPLSLSCRPGITGAATLVFASEEHFFHSMEGHSLNHFYATVVLPVKRDIDAAYMSRATFSSDLKLILATVFRRWDTSTMVRLLYQRNSRMSSFEEASGAMLAPQPAIGRQ